MVVIVETFEIEQWLYGLLSLDSQMDTLIDGRVFVDMADQGTIFPYVVFSFMAAHDVIVVGGVRVMTAAVYQIKAITDQANADVLAPIAKRIDELVDGQSGVVGSTGRILAAVRQSPVAMSEEDSGIQYRHRGGLYRIWAQPQ